MKRENFSRTLTLIQGIANKDAGKEVVLPFRMEFGKPFCRLHFWTELIQVAHRCGERAAEVLASIPPYRSRGHGKGAGFSKSWFSASNRASKSKYAPGAGFEFKANARRKGYESAWDIAARMERLGMVPA